MNPRIKELWIAALESNKYTQGMGRLRKLDNSFCCLGVLCDLYSQENKVEWDDPGPYECYKFLSCSDYLPEEVFSWAKLEHLKAYGDPDLVSLNDSGKTFHEIAQIIREKL